MGAVANLENHELAVGTGESVSTTMTVRNTGTVVDQFRISVIGDPGAWCTVEPPVLSLLPGHEATVTLRFAPPHEAATPFGQLPFGVRVEPQEDVAGTTVEEGVLTVAPYADLQVDVVPFTTKGWRRGRHEVTMVNRGNAPVTVHSGATDPNAALDLVVVPAEQQIAPGTAARAQIQARARGILWRGASQTMPFTLRTQIGAPPGTTPPQPVDSQANFLQNPIMPPWLPRTAATVAALAIGAIALWALLLRPAVRDAARSEVAGPIAQTDENLRKVADKVGVDLPPASGAPAPAPGASASAAAAGENPLGLPVTARLPVAAPPGSAVTGVAVPLPTARALTVARLLPQNPYRATGILTIGTVAATADGTLTAPIPAADRLVVVSLEDLSLQPLVFDPPLVLDPGRTLGMTVQCGKPGTGPNGAERGSCEVATLVSGYTRKAPVVSPSPPRPAEQETPAPPPPPPTSPPPSGEESPTPSPGAS
ncbi:hypothetical protein Cs7R123_26000 [Catellatospora sp. TT07R-123]|uniref:COG1470 family protein n=1 Tax=Catellatospora sp. TT07R-123 TaxID=2733863 RepID=UPI001B23DA4B|nr:hypothetical protein [Catellatospora sp. TT07R-123]GHJ45258.1 hypothetical protein Cs7R123_26000 [Catellatospora sp. TT07R-123]